MKVPTRRITVQFDVNNTTPITGDDLHELLCLAAYEGQSLDTANVINIEILSDNEGEIMETEPSEQEYACIEQAITNKPTH